MHLIQLYDTLYVVELQGDKGKRQARIAGEPKGQRNDGQSSISVWTERVWGSGVDTVVGLIEFSARHEASPFSLRSPTLGQLTPYVHPVAIHSVNLDLTNHQLYVVNEFQTQTFWEVRYGKTGLIRVVLQLDV